MRTLYLDLETTGLHPESGDMPVSIAVIDDNGQTILNSLVNPGRTIPAGASRVHGITNEHVKNAPTWKSICENLRQYLKDAHVIIYNLNFDRRFIPAEIQALVKKWDCCMLRFAPYGGEWNAYHRNWKWQKLEKAAKHCGYDLGNDAHDALADVKATRQVWHWLNKQESKN